MKNIIKKVLSFVLLFAIAVAFTSCKKDEPAPTPTIELTGSASEIAFGDTVQLTVTVRNAKNEAYTWDFDDTYLSLDYNERLTMKSKPADDVTVSIKVILREDASVSSTFKILVKSGKVDPVTPVQSGKYTISTDKTKVSLDETVIISVVKVNTEDDYTLSINEDVMEYVELVGSSLVVKKNPAVDKVVVITATSKTNPDVTGFKTIRVLAPVTPGTVYELTSAMIEEIANENITINGIIKDVYEDFSNPLNNSTNTYETTVKMEENKWYGAWNIKNSSVINETLYVAGEDGYKDSNGITGHQLLQVYIDKNNQVASKAIKNYESISAVWEGQHLWNHLGQLDVNRFEYDDVNKVYTYTLNETSEVDLYLMTYLSFCLTPLLDDTLINVYLTVEGEEGNKHITKLSAQSEVIYYGGDSAENATSMAYTTLEVTFDAIGTTVVSNPTPYAEPAQAEKLQTAITRMANATNYTFKIVETTTSAPSVDPDDYSYEASTVESTPRVKSKFIDSLSSKGQEGTVGYVTSDAIVLAKTGSYTYAMDDNKYFTNYSGYKQNADGTYDTFKFMHEYEGETVDSFVGTRKTPGSIFDVMPNFDFSTAIFKYAGSGTTAAGVITHTFVLRDSAITRDVAMEVSMSGYGSYGLASANRVMTIVTDDNGGIISITYPYDINGIYAGYYTVTFTKVGTTVLPEDTFDGYIPRVVKTSWSQYHVDYYVKGLKDGSTYYYAHSVSAQESLNALFGEDVTNRVVTPEELFGIFGDILYGPWADYDQNTGEIELGTDFSFNTEWMDYDENSRINDFDGMVETIIQKMADAGYSLSEANTDLSGGASGKATRYLTFTNDISLVVFEFNMTKNVFGHIYKIGDWNLH